MRWLFAVALALLVPIAPAYGAFPGANGKIATTWYDSFDDGVHTVNPDGSGDTWLTPGNPTTSAPAWSPDGTRIAFDALAGNRDVYVMNADGTNPTQLTSNSAYDGNPAWSPDGGRIVFESTRDGNRELYAMNADGSNHVRITNDPATDRDPSWSPDGTKIAFSTNREQFVCSPPDAWCEPRATFRVFTIEPDGSDPTRVTVTHPADSNSDGSDHYHPDWSPAGDRIVYQAAEADYFEEFWAHRTFVTGPGGGQRSLIYGGTYPDSGVAWSPDGQYLVLTYDYATYVMSADTGGYGETISQCCNQYPNWQPLPSARGGGYLRPRGATPIHLALVPAYNTCTSSNRTHGPPLAFGSCSPPQPASPDLTVGGSGGASPAKSAGYVRIDALVGAPGPPDGSDAYVTVSLSNVMRTSDLGDYTGALRATAVVRMTNRDAPPERVPATIQDFPLEVTMPCAGTVDTTLGADCSVQTTFDTLVPGLAPEGTRAIYELGQVQVRDGDGSLFAVQGLFVP